MLIPASTLPLPEADKSYLDRVRWVEVTNTESEAAPGGALLRTTGGESDGTISVAMPDADGQAHLMIAHPAGVPAGGVGLATYTDLVPAAYDTGDGTPAVGDTWGSAAGEWKLRLGNAGYRVTSDPVPSNGLHLVEVQRDASGTGAAQREQIVNVCKVMDECSGTYMTGMRLTWLKTDGTLECEDVSECPETGCAAMWYCVDGVVTEVEVADAPPAGDVVYGPYRTEAEADAACPLEIACGDLTYLANETPGIELRNATGCLTDLSTEGLLALASSDATYCYHQSDLISTVDFTGCGEAYDLNIGSTFAIRLRKTLPYEYQRSIGFLMTVGFTMSFTGANGFSSLTNVSAGTSTQTAAASDDTRFGGETLIGTITVLHSAVPTGTADLYMT